MLEKPSGEARARPVPDMVAAGYRGFPAGGDAHRNLMGCDGGADRRLDDRAYCRRYDTLTHTDSLYDKVRHSGASRRRRDRYADRLSDKSIRACCRDKCESNGVPVQKVQVKSLPCTLAIGMAAPMKRDATTASSPSTAPNEQSLCRKCQILYNTHIAHIELTGLSIPSVRTVGRSVRGAMPDICVRRCPRRAKPSCQVRRSGTSDLLPGRSGVIRDGFNGTGEVREPIGMCRW